MWMAGYASRTRPSEGTLTELHVKALALEDKAGTRTVIVSSDLIAIPRVLREQVTREVAEKFKLDPGGLMLNCSHTHCGPVVKDDLEMSVIYHLEGEQRERVEKYFVQLKDNVVGVIGAALKDLKPARLAYSHARCGFAMNRRLPSKNGYQNSPYPDGPVDHDIPVLRVESPDGKLRAIAFGYACHNTTTSLQQFNADYAGYAQTELEKQHPGITALFVMGCGGDQNPYPRGQIELAMTHGKTLATAVEAALLPEARPVHGPLKVACEPIDLDFAPVTRSELLARLESKDVYQQRSAAALLKEADENGKIRETYSYPIQVLQFGSDLTLVALAGETVVDYSLRLKRELAQMPLWVAGYSNDVFAYIPSQRVLLEGGYEGVGAMRYSALPGAFQPNVEEKIVGKVHAMVMRLRADAGQVAP
jgi:neutral/alkaline ceramidase-like enzyme